MKKISKIVLSSLCVLPLSLMAASNHPASQNPPAGLAVNNVPQFVVIGADDCGNGESVQWLVDFLKNKKNPAGKSIAGTYDGSKALMSFYLNGKYAEDEEVVKAVKNAIVDGHEIGNHTYSHFLDKNEENIDARLASNADWAKEISKNDSVISAVYGLGKDKVVGFRVPRLEYNAAGYQEIAKRPFLYDCSIEEGGEEGHNGTNYYWPYTMDKQPEIDRLQVEWSSGDDDWGYKTSGTAPGLWQLPVYNYIIVPDDQCKAYGIKPGLRKRVNEKVDYIETNITGFDYNLFAPKDWDGVELTDKEYLAVLKYSFDQHLKGNRTPFTMGMHPDFYIEETDSDYGSAGNYLARRAVVEEFLTYVLSKTDVRVVTGRQVIEWMKSPVGLDGSKGTASK